VVERRHYAGRERGRIAALDQLDQRVQVNRAFVRQLLSPRGVETGLAQPGAPPGNRVVGCLACRRLSAGSGLSSGSEIHISLAPAREPFLPLNEKTGTDQPARGGMGSATSPSVG
jgi:hypothetical protein